uniref:MAM domain containing glycosylphosphatidylinositol anchor 2 n=1 Tax=Cyprinus carpio TaxID=7962 RepID=A0A8C1S4F5_CYPCA
MSVFSLSFLITVYNFFFFLLSKMLHLTEERYSERVYTIREGETLELTCLVTGHPRPQIRWTKTAGSVSDRFQDSSVFNETLHIAKIQRHQGGRYYCKAENGLGSPAIKSMRVDVYYLDEPVVTVHQSIGEAKEQFYYERTVFLRCVANSNPPIRYSWYRGRDVLSQGSDKGVEIYEPFFTQGETKILKLKNLRPKDYANYSCIASVRNVCGIADRRVVFRLTNKTGEALKESIPSENTVLSGTRTTRQQRSFLRAGWSEVLCLSFCVCAALKKGRFWITPDPYHNDDNIQIGREVKISCQVEATPPEELQFSWLKNGRALRSSERMVITQTDPDISPGTTNLDIIDLKFTDFGTYTCVAALRGGAIPEISIDVNISSTTAVLVFGGVVVSVIRSGDQELLKNPLELLMNAFRGDYAAHLPGIHAVEMFGWRMSPEHLELEPNAPLNVFLSTRLSDPPAVEPVWQEVRQGLGRQVSMNCRVLRAHPSRVLRYEWRLGSRLLHAGTFDSRDDTDYIVRSLAREGYGEYTCDVINEVGPGRCTFLVTGETPPTLHHTPAEHSLSLVGGTYEDGQDRYCREMDGLIDQEIPVEGNIQKGELITHNLTELIRPEVYVVRLTPITRFGEGDSSTRVVTYSGTIKSDLHCTPTLLMSHCYVLCLSGFFMYIETSRPRKDGDTARLLSPKFNVAPKNPYSITSPPAYCFSFYYHMYGKHIGTLNAFVKQKGQSTSDASPVWSLSGNQGDRWRQAKISIHPTASFQVIFEGIRGPGIEGDIAIDDVTLEEGECPDPPSNRMYRACISMVTRP